jgi:glycine/D-amino acid oxidase-like deaminating enzyme
VTSYDAIIVGGGHNGLTCAAYLARGGLRVCVLERRHVLGGACVTEEVWPGRRVSRASYVVSMLQPKVVSELQLHAYGYEPVPLDPSYATFGADGRPIFFFNDALRTQESIARYSSKDARAYPAFEELLNRAASFLRPLLLRPPPALGSKRPGDLLGLLREAGRAAGLALAQLALAAATGSGPRSRGCGAIQLGRRSVGPGRLLDVAAASGGRRGRGANGPAGVRRRAHGRTLRRADGGRYPERAARCPLADAPASVVTSR